MNNVLLFILLGLGTGALYAGLAQSIVLTYRGSGTINMAAGAIAAVAAFVFFDLRTAGDLWLPPIPFAPHQISLGSPWATIPALTVAIAVAVLTGVLLELLVLRPLRHASPLARMVATLGVLLSLESVILLRFGSTAKISPAVLPTGTINMLGAGIPQDRFWLTGIVLATGAVLMTVYARTRFGLSTRAAAENELTAQFAGLSPNRLSMTNTVMAALLAGAVGVLAAPLTQLDNTTIPLAVVPALGAALLARFSSLGIATVAGLGMGCIESLLTYLQTQSWFPTAGGNPLPGVPDLIFFLIIVAVTFWRGRGLPDRGTVVEKRLPAAPAAQRIVRPAVSALLLIVAASVLFPYDFRQALINTLIGVVLCLSLVVITGLVGQISLLQVGLSGVAAFVMQKLAVHVGIGFPFGPMIAIAAGTLFGLATAVSALRVRGVNLAIVTLAGAVALENFWFQNSSWGAGLSGSPVSDPHLLGIDLGVNAAFPVGQSGEPSPVFILVCGVTAIGLGMLVASLRRSTLGQRMLAVRANERAAAGAGISVRNVKLTAFVISSAIAGTAGCLSAYGLGDVSASNFDSVTALTFVAFAYIGGITTVFGAVLGGLGVSEGLLGHAIDKWFGVPPAYQVLVGGLLLVVTIVLNPAGLALTPMPPPVAAILRRAHVGREVNYPLPPAPALGASAEADASLVGPK